jgi:hypothetical protein
MRIDLSFLPWWVVMAIVGLVIALLCRRQGSKAGVLRRLVQIACVGVPLAFLIGSFVVYGAARRARMDHPQITVLDRFEVGSMPVRLPSRLSKAGRWLYEFDNQPGEGAAASEDAASTSTVDALPDEASSPAAQPPDPPAGQTAPEAPLPPDAPSELKTADGPAESASSTDAGTPPAERPEWVDREGAFRADETYQMKIHVGPYTTLEECEKALPDAWNEAIRGYVDEYIENGAGGRVRLSEAYVREQMIVGRYDEPFLLRATPTQSAPMVRTHLLLAVTEETHERLKGQWKSEVVEERIGRVGGVGGGILAMVLALFGYLRIDTATKGYYSGRLKLAATGVILGAIAWVVLMFLD